MAGEGASTSRVLVGDASERLRELPASSVQTCITSPPYFGLRDYGHEGQIGLEPTVEAYVASLVKVFREVRRALRDDGTVWLNLGDSYHGGGYSNHRINGEEWLEVHGGDRRRSRQQDRIRADLGLKPKDLVGVPWRVAFALQADGWYLRSDVIFSKPNPMPESVTDRPTKAHEYVFLLTKSPRYFYDHLAIREPHTPISEARAQRKRSDNHKWSDGPGGQTLATDMAHALHPAGRNKRSVWTITTGSFPGAHFAVMPTALVEPCVLAGSPRQACEGCGAPWRRVTERGVAALRESARPQARRAAQLATEAGLTDEHLAAARAVGVADAGQAQATQNGINAQRTQQLAGEAKVALGGYFREFVGVQARTTGWEPSCHHPDATVGRSLILDPFTGSGTVGVVAAWHGRDFVGVELNDHYAAMAEARIAHEGTGRPTARPSAELLDQLGLDLA